MFWDILCIAIAALPHVFNPKSGFLLPLINSDPESGKWNSESKEWSLESRE